jgi:hypothetical protein
VLHLILLRRVLQIVISKWTQPPLALVLVDMTNTNMLICAVYVSHVVTVVLAHILAVFMRACLPALTSASTAEIVRNWICICCRIKYHGSRLTVLIDRELTFADAVDHCQLACAG